MSACSLHLVQSLPPFLLSLNPDLGTEHRSSMTSPFAEDTVWEPVRSDAPSSLGDRRHSSSASSSTLSVGDSTDSSYTRGRRARPSVASASSQLPTVREQKEQRALPLDKPPLLTRTSSQEAVVSSKKVATLSTPAVDRC